MLLGSLLNGFLQHGFSMDSAWISGHLHVALASQRIMIIFQPNCHFSLKLRFVMSWKGAGPSGMDIIGRN